MNCSAQSYSTRSTVNGEGVHWEKGEGGSNKTTSSLCERCIMGAVCHVKWYEVWAYRLRSPNGGGGDRPRPFIIIAIWAQALCWPRIAEIPLQGLKSAAAFKLCPCAGVSGFPVHDEWRGSSFPSEKAFSASREWGGMTATVAVAVQLCVTRTAAVCGVGVVLDWGHTPI